MRGHLAVLRAEQLLQPKVEQALRRFLHAARAALLDRDTDVAAQLAQVVADAAAADLPPNLDAWPHRSVWQAAVVGVVSATGTVWREGWDDTLSQQQADELSADDFLAEHLADAAARLNDASWPDDVYDAVVAQMVLSVSTREPLALLRERVANVLTLARWAGRTVMIARNESLAARNAGTYAAGMARVRTYGDTLYKQWVAVGDRRTRPTHMDVDGTVVGADESFDVGGSSMRYPHDPAGAPDQVIMCRCVLDWVDGIGVSATATAASSAPSSAASTAAFTALSSAPSTAHSRSMTMGPTVSKAATAGTTVAAAGPASTQTSAPTPPGPASAPATDPDTAPAVDPAGAPPADPAPEPGGEPPAPPTAQSADGPDPVTAAGQPDGDPADADPASRPAQVDPGDQPGAAPEPTGEQPDVEGPDVDQADVESQPVDGESVEGPPVDEPDDTQVTAATSGATRLRLADQATRWSRDDAVAKVKKWATRPSGTLDWAKYGRAFFQRSAAGPDGPKQGDFSLPFATVVDGELVAVPAGVSAAAARLSQTDMPDSDKAGVQAKIGAYYTKMRRTPPWAKTSGGKGRTRTRTTPRAVAAAAGDRLSWAEQVAANVPDLPAAAWFDNPQLSGPTKLHVTDEGRVFGHIARWDALHEVYKIPPPRCRHGGSYPRFHRHPVRTVEGPRLLTGPIATGGHASTRGGVTMTAAQAHYDDPRFVGANVRVGEDAYGIWAAGALRPGVAPFQVSILDVYSQSGDWREGELIASCAVTAPAFDLGPDSVFALAAAAGDQVMLADPTVEADITDDGVIVALVAAGIVVPDVEPGAGDVTAAGGGALDGWTLYRQMQAAQAADGRVRAARRRVLTNQAAIAAAANRVRQGA
jgi:hypothetical protein